MTLLQFFQAYLFAWIFWTTLTLGCTALTLLYHATRGSWALPILRILEAGNKMLPVMGALFIPVIIFMGTPAGHDLYHWLDPGNDPILKQKVFYLNIWRFAIFQIVYFLSLWALTHYLNSSAKRQDETGDPNEAQKRANVAAPGLVWFVISSTFAYTDWVMSLDPHWFSTIFGAWFLVGAGLMASSFATIIVSWRAFRMRKKLWVDIMEHNWQFKRDMGNMMLMFTMLWAYFSLSQLLIIWSGNLPEETSFYVNRTTGGWLRVGSALLAFQFLVPFLCLLSGRAKRKPELMFLVALMILIMRVVDVFWTVVPFFHHPSVTLYLLCLGAWIGLGAVWLYFFAQKQSQMTILPTHDPRLQESMTEGAVSHA